MSIPGPGQAGLMFAFSVLVGVVILLVPFRPWAPPVGPVCWGSDGWCGMLLLIRGVSSLTLLLSLGRLRVVLGVVLVRPLPVRLLLLPLGRLRLVLAEGLVVGVPIGSSWGD